MSIHHNGILCDPLTCDFSSPSDSGKFTQVSIIEKLGEGQREVGRIILTRYCLY